MSQSAVLSDLDWDTDARAALGAPVPSPRASILEGECP